MYDTDFVVCCEFYVSTFIWDFFLHFYSTFIDGKGSLRIGGWIRRLGLNEKYIHLIISPRESNVTVLIVKWCHLKVANCGRDITLNELGDFLDYQ